MNLTDKSVKIAKFEKAMFWNEIYRFAKKDSKTNAFFEQGANFGKILSPSQTKKE